VSDATRRGRALFNARGPHSGGGAWTKTISRKSRHADGGPTVRIPARENLPAPWWNCEKHESVPSTAQAGSVLAAAHAEPSRRAAGHAKRGLETAGMTLPLLPRSRPDPNARTGWSERAERRAMNLLWNEGGEIACAQHAPGAGTDTRVWGRWRPISKAEADEFAREVGRAPECETCRAEKRKR